MLIPLQTAPRDPSYPRRRTFRRPAARRRFWRTLRGHRSSVAGIAMRVRVPLASYRGVRLWLAAEAEGGSLHTIELLHRDPDLSVPLFQTTDTGVLAAERDSWAKSLSLPLLFEDLPARTP